MPLSPREKFKYGFLVKAAQAQLTPDEIDVMARRALALVKQADEGGMTLGGTLSSISSGVSNAAGSVLGMGGKVLGGLTTASGLGLAGAATLGAAGGMGLAKLREGTIDEDEVRKQELIAAYNSFEEQMRMQDKLRNRQKPNQLRVRF